MGIIQDTTKKIRQTINFNKPVVKPSKDTEIGASGDLVFGSFDGEELRNESIKISQLKKMKENDGTVKALYNFLTLPILANTWRIVADENDKDEVQAQLVKDNFQLPLHRGGMSTPFQLVLSQSIRAILEGFALFEKVYDIREDGKIIYRKIAHRDSETITLLRDEKGGFGGAKQKFYTPTAGYNEVIIPVEKLFLYTYGKDTSFLYGESAFKAAYYHYDKKHKFYYLLGIQAQSSAVAPRIVRGPKDPESTDKEATQKAAGEFGVKTTIYIPDGFDIESYDTKRNMELLPVINHHNMEMSRSVMAQFMMLGGENQSGSFALSKDQSDMFLMAIRGTMRDLESHINSYLIPDLHTLNFEKPYYSEFKFDDMTDTTQDMMKEVFNTIITKDPNKLSDDFVDAITKDVASQLGIDIDELTKASENQEKKEKAPAQARFARKKRHRKLTHAEERVDFDRIEKNLDNIELDFQNAVKPLFNDLKKEALLKVTNLVENKNYDALAKMNLKGFRTYRKLLKDKYTESYMINKELASEELEVNTPTTPKETKAFIESQAQAIADKHFTDLLFLIKTEVAKELRRNTLSKDKIKFGLTDALSSIGGGFDSYFSNEVALTGSLVASMGMNKARQDVFESNRRDIEVYQYSAILDDRTCDCCNALDGAVVSYEEYRSTSFEPPVHFRCRCAWIAIKSDQDNIPLTTGIPTTAESVCSGLGMPSFSRDDDTNEEITTFNRYIDELVAFRKDLQDKQLKDKEIEAKIAELDTKIGE